MIACRQITAALKSTLIIATITNTTDE